MTNTTKHLTLDTTKAHNRRTLDFKVRQAYEEYAKQTLALVARAGSMHDAGGDPDWVMRSQISSGFFTTRETRRRVMRLFRAEKGEDLAHFYVSNAQIRASVRRLSKKELGNVVRTTTRGGSGTPTGTLIWFTGPDFNDELSFHSRTLHGQYKKIKNAYNA